MNYDDLLRELKMEAVSFPDISVEDLADIIHALEKHFCNAIKDAVPVRHGRWINAGFLTAKCSVCDAEVHELEYGNYCPNCGARMDEEKDRK